MALAERVSRHKVLRQINNLSNSGRRFALLAKGLAVAVAALLAAPAIHADSASLDGSWRGSGWVNFDNGKREKARCKARYSRVTPTEFTLSANCATASAKATQTARVHKVGSNSYSGNFFNKEFGVTGTIHVKVEGRSQSVHLSSSGGTASIQLRK